MKAQAATLRRGTVHIPVLPVAVVVVAATAAVVGLSSIDSIHTTAVVRERGALIKDRGFAVRPKFSEPTTSIREQGTLSATNGPGDSIALGAPAVADAPLPTRGPRDILPMSTGVPIKPGGSLTNGTVTSPTTTDPWVVNDIKIGNR
jgi:hypothetical protein